MEIISLVIPFIVVAILSVLIDKLTLVLEGIIHRIPKFPDKIEWWAAYLIVLLLAYLVCSEGNFDLFSYLNVHFRYAWEGYLLTALLVSGGSAFVRTNFLMIDQVPNVARGISTTIKSRILTYSKDNKVVDSTLTDNVPLMDVEFDNNYIPDQEDNSVVQEENKDDNRYLPI